MANIKNNDELTTTIIYLDAPSILSKLPFLCRAAAAPLLHFHVFMQLSIKALIQGSFKMKKDESSWLLTNLPKQCWFNMCESELNST